MQLRPVEVWYDEFADWYDGEFTSALDRAENELVLRAIKRAYVDGAEIVDLGCGTGLLLDLLPQIEPERYTGIDISKRMVSRAEQKHPVHLFHVGDAMRVVQYRVAEGCAADVAVCLWAANFGNLERLANAAWLALRPGGRAVFVVNGAGRLRSKKEIEVPNVWEPCTANQLREVFCLGFHCRVRGFSLFENPPLPRWYLPIEYATLGRLNLNRSKHFIFEATKR